MDVSGTAKVSGTDGWNAQDALDAIDAENPPELGPEPKSESIVVSVGAFAQECHCMGITNPHAVQSHGRVDDYPQWDAEVARNAAAILAGHGG